MSKLTTHQFVEIFNESKVAGQAMYTQRGGQLPMKGTAKVMSTFTGLFCADRDTLLIETEAKAYDGMSDVTVDEMPRAKIVAVRGLDVTRAVRELPDRADEFHRDIAAICSAEWPDLNAEAQA